MLLPLDAVGSTVKARNNALDGNISKHPKTGRYYGPGRYLGPMDEFFSRVPAQYICSLSDRQLI